MARPPTFVQFIPSALDELAEELELDFIEQAVLTRATLEANWQTGAIPNWTTTGYAGEWRIGYRLLKRAVDRLVDLGPLVCTATRGHPGELVVTVYDRLVRARPDDNAPGRSRESARADDGRNRDSAIGNRESARAQPRKRDSEQGERPLDIEDRRPPSNSPTDAEVDAATWQAIAAKEARGEVIHSKPGLFRHLRPQVAAELLAKVAASPAGAVEAEHRGAIALARNLADAAFITTEAELRAEVAANLRIDEDHAAVDAAVDTWRAHRARRGAA